MIRLNNILVPIDFSDASQKAINYGLSLALQFQARLVTAHVVSSLAAFNYSYPDEAFDLEKRASLEAKDRMPEQVPPEYRDRVHALSIVKTGDVREELLGIIGDEDIDLVVMGTHGRRHLERFFLGSTTEAMLRKVPVPILTVSRLDPATEIHTANPIPIRRIVYATDLSDGSEIGFRYSAELARTFGADLMLLHAMDSREIGAWDIVLNVPAGTAAARQKASARMQQIAAAASDMKIEIAVVEGIPYRAITQFAEDSNAHLLVLNLHNKGILERAMLGSTAERVIRSARAPVLSLPVMTDRACLPVQLAAYGCIRG